MISRNIPASNEPIPVIGLGTWQVFDTNEVLKLETLSEVLIKMYRVGGRIIDSSPMYGLAEKTIGDLTSNMDIKNDFFYATKVWIKGKQEGINQMQASLKKMKRSTIDLMQIHNLVDWQTHIKTLRQWKEEGKIRYVGITHYTDSMHEALEEIIMNEPVDFVQFNYSITNRHAEKKLLPLAAEKGVATIINRPFGEGALFKKTKGKDLPSWLEEYNIKSWSEFFLKFILSHPAVTCIIPATSDHVHLQQNMRAATGLLPDKNMREKMAAYISTL